MLEIKRGKTPILGIELRSDRQRSESGLYVKQVGRSTVFTVQLPGIVSNIEVPVTEARAFAQTLIEMIDGGHG